MQSICLVIPCYNEENRIPLEGIELYLRSNAWLKVLFVNDGSTDGTLGKLQSFCNANADQCKVYDQQPNGGKAEAVRQGMQNALVLFPNMDYYGYWDADMSTPLVELEWFHVISGGQLHHKMILGTRLNRLGAEIHRSPMRHYLGRIFATFASMILDLPVYDTQCGAKLLQRDIVPIAFKEPFITRWFFDVEIFARLQLALGKVVVKNDTLEVPLRTWNDVKGTKLKWMDFIKVPLDLLKIRSHYKKP